MSYWHGLCDNCGHGRAWHVKSETDKSDWRTKPCSYNGFPDDSEEDKECGCLKYE